jgi:O-antigen/teichoic acid export membrane protein
VFRSWLAITLAVVTTGVLLMVGFAEWLTAILLAEQYRGAALLLPWIGAAYALQACRQIFDAVVLAGGRTSRLVLVQLIAAPISVVLYFLLIPRLEALGAAIATLVAMVVALAAAMVLSGAVPRLLIRRAPDAPDTHHAGAVVGERPQSKPPARQG